MSQKLGLGRAVSRASALPPVGPLALIVGVGLGALLFAFHLVKKG